MNVDEEDPSNMDLAKMLCNLSQQRPPQPPSSTQPQQHQHHRASSDDTSGSSSASPAPSAPPSSQDGSSGSSVFQASARETTSAPPTAETAITPQVAAPATTSAERPKPLAAEVPKPVAAPACAPVVTATASLPLAVAQELSTDPVVTATTAAAAPVVTTSTVASLPTPPQVAATSLPPVQEPVAAAPVATTTTATIHPPAASSTGKPPAVYDADATRRISLPTSQSPTRQQQQPIITASTTSVTLPATKQPQQQAVTTTIPPQQHFPSLANVLPLNVETAPPSIALPVQQPNATAAASAMPSFPVKLYQMMQESAKHGFEDIVSWQPSLAPNGNNSDTTGSSSSFKVHHTDRFVSEIMPRYFKQTKFKSFQRQLNIYGFNRIHDGANRGGYMHPYFQQGRPELLKLIPRKRAPEQQFIQARGNQHPTSSNVTVNTMHTNVASNANNSVNDQLVKLLQTAAASVSEDEATRLRVAQQASNLLLLNAAQPPGQQLPPATFATAAAALRAAAASVQAQTPVAATIATSTPAPPLNTSDLPDSSFADPNNTNKNQHVFPWKLYKMLEDAEESPASFSHIVSWVNDGKSFKVHNTKEFVAVVMPQYFDQTKYESFRRQLNLYGFTRVVRGQHRGVYSHPLFQRGHKDWCRFISRNQASQMSQANINGNSTNGSGMAQPFPLPPLLGKGDANSFVAAPTASAASAPSPFPAIASLSPPATAPAPANVTHTAGV